MKPLVSILIPAYNAEETIAETLHSAVGQTWPHKEIIVVDDGSTDRTAEIASSFGPAVTVVATENRGLSAAVNCAYAHSRGDYIQELDSDDILSPEKIERQLGTLSDGDSKLLLLSSPWAPFHYRTRNAPFIETSLCEDLTPVEWILRKMAQNLHMQNATWLMSRELAETAGSWDERLRYDQDGEYYVRVVKACTGIRFVQKAGVYYRNTRPGSISYIGNSNPKRDSLLRSMKLHIQYLRSLEESDRVRQACVTYMQNWYDVFYPDREDAMAELQALALELGGSLIEPRLRWKYRWMKPLFGWHAAKQAQMTLPQVKASWARAWDKTMYRLESRHADKRTAVKV